MNNELKTDRSVGAGCADAVCEIEGRDVYYADLVPSSTSRITATLVAVIALFVSSCGGSQNKTDAHPNRSDDTPVISGEPAANSAVDITFADNITDRQEQGTSWSKLVPARSSNTEVVTFAARTAAALGVDTQVLKALRAQWKESQDNRTGTSASQARPRDPADDPTIAKLASLRGAEFDTLWLNSMISLYQGIIDLANGEVRNGKNADATSLAKQIVKARQADIGEMQQLLAT